MAAERGNTATVQSLLKVCFYSCFDSHGYICLASPYYSVSDLYFLHSLHRNKVHHSLWPCPQAGADPDAKEQTGARPIDSAAGAQEKAVVELLLPRTSPGDDHEWTVDALMVHAASQEQHQHQHNSCCGCGHEHEHVDEQVRGCSRLAIISQYIPC